MPTWEMGAGVADGNALGAASTRYVALSGGQVTSATEADLQTLVRDTLTLDNLFVRITANATTATSTVRSRKNAANGAQSVSIGSGATGVFEDTTNSDSLVSGDLVNAQAVVGAGGSLTYSIIGFQLTHTTDNVPLFVSTSAFTQANALTRYRTFSGYSGPDATESKAQLTMRVASTLSRLICYVSANSIVGGSTTFQTRINAANGAQSVSIGAGATGRFEDTVNTDAVLAGDEVNYTSVTGGTSGTLTIVLNQVKSAAAGRNLGAAYTLGAAFSSDLYAVADGYIAGNATESNTQRTCRFAFTARNMCVNVSAHGLSGGVNVYLRQNGANSALTVSIAESTTGIFEDTTNTVSVALADTYNYFLDHGGGAGSITCTVIGFELAQPAAAGSTVPQGTLALLHAGR